MARRRSSGGSGGVYALLGILALIAIFIKALPYLLLIAACILGVWGVVKVFQYLNDKINGSARIVNNNNYAINGDTCFEVDRQIKETLVRRNDLNREIKRIKFKIARHSLFWMKNDEKHITAKDELTKELNILEGRYNAAVYAFRESVTQEFTILRTSFNALCRASTKTYDSTPASSHLSIPYDPKGDMEYITFSTEPLCISLGDNIFCVIPYYIVHFKKNGTYVSTYSCKEIRGGVANGSYDERIKHVTWTYTRADGLPDRRYKNNPQRVYYTTTTHTVWNMLALGILNYQLKYEVDNTTKNSIIAAIKAYSALVPIKSYDPVHHLIRLLKECDTENPNIAKIESIIEDGGITVQIGETSLEQAEFRQESYSISEIVEQTSVKSWNALDVIKTVIGIGLGGISSLFCLLMMILTISQLVSATWSLFFSMLGITGIAGIIAFLLIRMAVRIIQFNSDNPPTSDNSAIIRKAAIITAIVMGVLFFIGIGMGIEVSKNDNLLDEQEISEIITKWKSDGVVDYTDVAEFEKDVNDGKDLVGKTVTFTVVEVHPDSALGFDIWGGEHLNFVSKEDPGVKEGEEISVIATGIRRVLTDSFKITYVLLK